LKHNANITWIAILALVVQATCGGCTSRSRVQFASNTADILTGPSLNHTLAPPITFESDMPQTARPMSLEDAIHLAFQNTKAIRSLGAQILSNPSSVQSSLDPAINATDPIFGIDAALAQFDANLSASLIHANNDDVFNNSILGGGATEVVQDLTTADLQINKTNIYGTQYNLRSNIRYDNNDNISSTFPSSYSTFWEATARHPLLQGRGFAFNQIAGPNNSPGFRNTSGIAIARINQRLLESVFCLSKFRHHPNCARRVA